MSKVTELKQCRKAELIILAEELGVELEAGDTIPKIIRKIETSEDYDKELAVAQIRNIIEDRENQNEQEREREKFEREERRLEQERVYNLEHLRLTQNPDRRSSTSSNSEDRTPKITLKSIMHKFDPERSDITLFLNLFERQASRSNIEEGDYVTHLLSLLPVEIAEIILREPAEKIDDFAHIKEILLERFKLNHETYRQKFTRHQRNPANPWKDMIFELNSYLEGWLKGLKIQNFEDLKKLLITDQIKNCASEEIREHFIDTWANFIDPLKLTTCLDQYEALKGPERKLGNRNSRMGKRYERSRNDEVKQEEVNSNIKVNGRDKDEIKERERIFERRRLNKCFVCGSPNHYKYNCPDNKKNDNDMQVTRINHVYRDSKLEEGI